ncbi:MAG TPA: hypothetical protein VFE89_13090 [Beijerinckiaceae bacterium]|nr:hypothetical protein [Beijerinckiaceae bacterium]
MPHVRVGPALPDGSTLDVEIARLRDLDVASLRARLHNVFRRRPSPHLPRHLLFPIGFRPNVSTIWMSRAAVFSMGRARPKMPASARWT